jgi:hypothetical protein
VHETITNVYNISILRKEWKNVSWVFYDGYNPVYRWKLEISEYGWVVYPEWY